jgi:hypothetical protein
MKNIRTFVDTLFNLNLTSPVWDFLGNQYNDTLNKHIWDINSSINDGYPYIRLYNFNTHLISPTNGSSDNIDVNFNCFASSQSNLNSVTLQIWNETSGNLYYNETITPIGVNETTASFDYNFTDEGNYLWNCLFTDEVTSISSDLNYTLFISLIAPAVTLNNPLENEFFNYQNNILFNFTGIDNDGLSVCELWENFTGNWKKNYTWSSPISEISSARNLNLVDNYYLWNVWCNDTFGNGAFHENNHTFSIDTIYPIEGNITIAVTQNSESFLFLTNITDINLNMCKYTIKNLTGQINGVNENITFSCNQLSSASTSGFGDYILYIDAYDKANNHIQQNKSFTTSFVSPPPEGSGGTTPSLSAGNWTMETEFAGSKYQFSMIQSSSRNKDLLFENLGTTSRTITLSCQPVSGTADLCGDITFEKNTFTLPLQKGIKTSVGFTLKIPDNFEKGKYVVNLVATDEQSNIGIITTEIDITSSSSITGIISKLFSNTKNGIPYFLLFILVALLAGVLSNFLLFKPTKLPSALSVLVGLVFGIIFLLLPI